MKYGFKIYKLFIFLCLFCYFVEYVVVTCGKNLNDCRGEIWAHTVSLTHHLLLKCLYQARKVTGHVFVS